MEMRSANLFDLLRIMSTRGRQHVLRLNPPYTLVQPEAQAYDLLRSRLPIRPQVNYVYVYAEGSSVLGYVQARCRWHRRDEWTVTTIGLSDQAPDDLGEVLLEAVAQAAGEEGVMRLFVKVPRGEPLIGAFRALGFTHYTRERIWGNLYFTTSNVPREEPPLGPLRRHTNTDAWDLMQMYSSIAPPAVRRAEDLNSSQWRRSRIPRPWFLSQGLMETSYVWPDQASNKAGLGGYARLLTGARGHWITVMFRPEAANRAVCPLAIDCVLWKAARIGDKPVYCGVREYQTEVEGDLEDRGFHLLSEQDLLVKYLVKPVETRQSALARLLAARREMAPTK